MKSFETIVRPDADGVLRLAVPVEDASREYRVIVDSEIEPRTS